MTKNLNPFSSDRKLTDKIKHEKIYMLWRECIPVEYYRFISEEKKFLYSNGKNVLQPKILYSNIYPEVYCATKKRGFDLKSNFHIMFKTYKNKMQIRSMGKNPINY